MATMTRSRSAESRWTDRDEIPRPGPWRLSRDSTIVDAIGIEIAHEAPGLGPRGEATMQLIAAAPELLALVQEMAEHRGGIGWQDRAERVLAAATGRRRTFQ